MVETIATTSALVVVPTMANAATGESPRFSVFGLLGDGTSYSEGAAYGSDQAAKTYSPYSVYGKVGANDALYTKSNTEYSTRKKAVLAETKKRLGKLPRFIERAEWFNVTTELTRFMYETRGAVRFLAETPEQKKAATAFFKAIERTDQGARRKNGEACAKAAAESVQALDAFTALL